MSRRGRRRVARVIREQLGSIAIADPESYKKALVVLSEEVLRRGAMVYSDMEPEHAKAYIEGIMRACQEGVLPHPEILEERMKPGLVLVRVLCGACSRLVMVMETHGDRLSLPFWFRRFHPPRYDILPQVAVPFPLIRVYCPEHGERSTPVQLLAGALRRSLCRVEPDVVLPADPESFLELVIAIERRGQTAPVTTRALPPNTGTLVT